MHQINLALVTLLDGLRALARPALVTPIWCFALAQIVMLLAIVNFHVAPMTGALAPIMRLAAGGEAAVRYPTLYVVLPAIFNFFDLILSVTVGAYLWGVAVLAIGRYFGVTGERPWSGARRRLGQLVLAQIPVFLLALLVFFVPQALLQARDIGGWNLRLLNIGTLGFGILVQALFLLAPVAIVIERLSAPRAIARSFELFARHPMATLLVVALPTALHLPVVYVLRRSWEVVRRFSPETVALVIGGDILIFVFTNFVLVVAATLLFRAARKER